MTERCRFSIDDFQGYSPVCWLLGRATQSQQDPNSYDFNMQPCPNVEAGTDQGCLVAQAFIDNDAISFDVWVDPETKWVQRAIKSEARRNRVSFANRIHVTEGMTDRQ